MSNEQFSEIQLWGAYEVIKLVNVQPLRDWPDRIAGEGALQDGEHAVPLLAQRCEACADDAEMLGAGERAQAAGDFLFDLGHATGRQCGPPSLAGQRAPRATARKAWVFAFPMMRNRSS